MKEQREQAAMEIVRRIVKALEDRRQAESINRNLQLIAGGKIGFGDICDDNVFIHEVLAEMKLTPADASECVSSTEHTGTWNTVVALLPWAARRVLVERCATMALPSHCGDCGVLLMGGATQHKPSCSIRRMIEEVMEGNKQC